MKRLFSVASPATWLTFVGTVAAATMLMVIIERLVQR